MYVATWILLSFWSVLDWGFLSEHIRGDVYSVRCTIHAILLLNVCSKSLIAGENYRTHWNKFSKCVILGMYILHTHLHNHFIVHPRMYSCSPSYIALFLIIYFIHLITAQIKCDVWYTILFINLYVSHPYENSISGNFA